MASILFLTQVFLLWVVLQKEYRKQNWGMNIVKIKKTVKIVEKEVKNLARGR